jgi:hypothetical protein
LIRVSPGNRLLGILLLATVALGLPSADARKPGLAAAAIVAGQLPALNELLKQGLIDSTTVGAAIDRLVDFRAFTKRTFGNYTRRSLEEYEDHLGDEELERLIARHETRLVSLLRTRLIGDLADLVRRAGLTRLELKTRAARMSSSHEASLGLRGQTLNGESLEVGLMLERNGKGWQVVDLLYDRVHSSKRYARELRDVLKNDYSLSVLAARLNRENFIRLEDFSSSQVGLLPEGWYVRGRDEDKPKLYEVQEHEGSHYLAAQDTALTVILLKVAHWNPHEFPILTWCWRADALPPKGNEHVTETNDSAAGVYVIFQETWGLGLPIQNKYVWSTTLPEGTIGRRNMIARPYFLVEQSGEGSLGRWEFEQVDLMADYNSTFGGEPKTRTLGIGVLTDSNNTYTYAEAYYADIRAWRREAVEEEPAIPNHCTCLPAGDLTPRLPTKIKRTN